jgi:hypothetical protein
MSSEPAYERLGAKVLSLPDVIAQSVGFMGPIFSSAFVIPLVVGVISASGKGGGVAAPLSVIIAGIGVFALGWIVSSYAREIHSLAILVIGFASTFVLRARESASTTLPDLSPSAPAR